MAESNDAPHAILIVDDDELLRTNAAEILVDAGYLVEQAGTGQEAAEMLDDKRKDLVITDIFMPDMDGIELVRHLHGKAGDTRLLAMSGYVGDVDYLEAAEALGACMTLRKPFRSQELIEAVEHCLNTPDKSLADSIPVFDDQSDDSS